MATESWTRDLGVGHSLAQSPQEFRFFQAVRLMRLFARAENGPYKGRSLSFRTHLPLEFPASEIFDLLIPEEPESDPGESLESGVTRKPAPLSMFVTFMGLTGTSGVLPYHYTELLLQREVALQRQGIKEDPAHAFFDLFSHRLIELFYEAWQKYRFYLHFERGEAGHLPQHLLDLVGMGVGSLQGRLNRDGQGVPDAMLGYYAGVLSNQKHSAQTLARVTQDYFGIETGVAQLQARWLMIRRADQSRLGSNCSALGMDAVLGDRTWDTQTLCRVYLGPMSVSEYRALLPHGKAYSALCRFLRWYLGWALDVELQLKLAGAPSADEPLNPRGAEREGWSDVPLPRLGHDQDGVRLGWMGWLGGRIKGNSADDCALRVEREQI